MNAVCGIGTGFCQINGKPQDSLETVAYDSNHVRSHSAQWNDGYKARLCGGGFGCSLLFWS